MLIQLGRLESVDIRKVWESEARDFTTWLAEPENLSLLGETLGLMLELEAREKSVGSFAADLLARDSTRDAYIVIENQLEPTDHRHLGQLLTYAAGLQAQSIVWIATEFRDEHRAAIDWLNSATREGFDFFAVQIEAYRIGDSIPAPRFNILAKPNNWVRRAAAGREQAESAAPSASQAKWTEYWRGLIQLADSRVPLLLQRAPSRQNWQPVVWLKGSKDLRFTVNIVGATAGLRVELYIDGRLANAAFRTLETRRDEIEASCGLPLTWEPLPAAQACRVSLYMPGNVKAELTAKSTQYEWIISVLPSFLAAMQKIVDQVDPQALAIAEQSATTA